MNKRDVFLLAFIVVISAVLFVPTLFAESGTDAFIYVKGELYGRYDLAEPKEIHIDRQDNKGFNIAHDKPYRNKSSRSCDFPTW